MRNRANQRTRFGKKASPFATAAAFYPLKTSLNPTKGSALTFTRATGATVLGYAASALPGDAMQILKVNSGEARFQGARRVSAGVWSDTYSDGTPIAPSTLKGILIEPARTNSARSSDDFTNATYWVQAGTTTSGNVATAPDGTSNADKLTESVGNTSHIMASTGVLAGVQTFSIYAKLASGTRLFQLRTHAIGAGVCWASFNLQTGVVAASGGTGVSSPAIYSVGNGWYRCSVSYTGTLSTAMGIVFDNSAGSELPVYVGDGTSAFYIWGAQQESGVNASSYIPTTTVAVARNADVLTAPTSGQVLDSIGTVYAEVTPVASLDNSANILSTNGAEANELLFGGGTTARIHDGTTDLNSAAFGVLNTTGRIATCWGGATKYATYNGVAPVSNAFDGSMGVGTTMNFGVAAGHSSAFVGGIKNVRAWTTQLTAAQLSAITA